MNRAQLAYGWIILMACLLLVSASIGHPATYWVSPQGSSGSGCVDSATPLTTTAKRTIQGGVACLTSPGAVLKVRNGTYTERVDLDGVTSGVSGNPVILEAENARQVFWHTTDTIALGIENINYVTIRGFVFDGSKGGNNLPAYTTIPVSGAQQLLSIGCSDPGISSTCSHHITIENNEFRFTAYGLTGVSDQSHDIVIRNNWIHHQCKVKNCNVLYASGPTLTFENNLVEDIAGSISLWNAGPATANNGILRNNTFRRMGAFWATDNGSLQCCAKTPPCSGDEGLTCSQRMPQGHISHNSGIGIAKGTGTQVYNNVFENNYGGSISADNGGDNCLIANNTIYGNLGPPEDGEYAASISLNISGHGAANCAIRNNIVYQPGVTNPPQIYDGGTGTTLSNNLCSSADTGCTIVGNPGFVSVAGGNFRLAAGSPAIGQGVQLNSLFTTDADGTVRGTTWDIGAFEATAGAQPDPVNLLLHLPLTEGVGTTAADMSGNNHPGVLDIAAWSSPGMTGSSAFTPTGTEEISVANVTGLGVTTSCSLAAWIKMSTVDAAGCSIVSNREGCSIYLSSTGLPECWIYNGSNFLVARGSTSVLDGVAHHLICSYDAQDGSGLRGYVDTVPIPPTPLTDLINYGIAGGAFRIARDGANFGGYQCRGPMNAVYLYQGRLSAEARQNLYNELVPASGLSVTHMAWYEANAAAGSAIGTMDTNISQVLTVPLGVRWAIHKADPGSLTEYFRPFCRVLSSTGALVLDWTEITNTFGALGIRMYADSVATTGAPAPALLPTDGFTSGTGIYLENPVDTTPAPYDAVQKLTIGQGEHRELEMKIEFGSPRRAGERIECRPHRENGVPFTSYMGIAP